MDKQFTPIKQALNKAFLKEKVARPDIEIFKSSLQNLLVKIDTKESEANLRDHLRDFLNDIFYKEKHLLATKGQTDLVIHADRTARSQAAVLFEVKRPKNTAEMVSLDNLNRKALQELILYYLRERIEHENREIKTLIITDIHTWFVFDENEFDRHVFANEKIRKYYLHCRDVEKNNDRFYKTLKEELIPKFVGELNFTYFDLRDYQKIAADSNPQNDHLLIPLFKVFSPAHLLKQPFANDSNSLDRPFYNELLHLIGLEEVKEGGKKIIQRKPKNDRHAGSLLENTIATLETEDCLRRLPNLKNYGSQRDEQLFNVALELTITWMNRILFLKLLEAQLLAYHEKNEAFRFLNFEKIKDFDELNELFFDALAKLPADRPDFTKTKFERVPYLNSSLFEISDLEAAAVRINSLKDRLLLPLAQNSVLKKSPRHKNTAEIRTLEYIFNFLDAYDFSAEGSEEIQEEAKTLINASVLGLIFEKINGYRDGSFFTPGFVTMYMCRETIRRAVLQKFNERHGWRCQDLGDLRNHLADRRSKSKILEDNATVNSLKICDPAVGSGHFLVSALNEIIAIKSELRILADEHGKCLSIEAKVENDELVVTDGGSLFTYVLKKGKAATEAQRSQQTLFREKQNLIENCLFGVDINPNSVKICRLRLWIELLKNAFYKTDGELETLPNIDINIKQGNSLIARFGLDEDLTPILKKSKVSIEDYQNYVRKYHHARDKDEKRELLRLIEDLKTNFRTEIGMRDKKYLELKKIENDFYFKYASSNLFGEQPDETQLSEKQVKEKAELAAKIEKLKTELDDRKNNAVFQNAFEWRFEFPEVLDFEGRFLGFDCVVGNPPYINSKGENFSDSFKSIASSNYQTAKYQIDTYILFIERGLNLITGNGKLTFIVPNAWLNNLFLKEVREYFLKKSSIESITSMTAAVFEEASVDTIILSTGKKYENCKTKINFNVGQEFFLQKEIEQDSFLNNEGFIINVRGDNSTDSLLIKIESKSVQLETFTSIARGVGVYHKRVGHTPEIIQADPYQSTFKKDETFIPYLRGKNIVSYSIKWLDDSFISYGKWLAEPREPKFFEGKRILLRQIPASKLIAAFIEEDFVVDQSVFIAKFEDNNWNPICVLGIISSKLMSFYFRNKYSEFDEIFPKLKLQHFKNLPISIEKTNELELETLVEKILESKRINPSADTQSQEKEIDKLVYGLYGLTEEEISVIESSGGK